MTPAPSAPTPDLSSGAGRRMERTAPLATPPSLPKGSAVSDPLTANGNGNLGLMRASSSGSPEAEKEGARGTTGGGSNIRRRRRQRLGDSAQSRLAARSPPTISEHASLDHHSAMEKEGTTSLSADMTSETTMLSTDDPESADDSVRVRQLPITPMKYGLHSPGVSPPQSVLTSKKSFTPPELQTRRIPPRLSASMREMSAPESSSAAQLPRRQRPQSLWDEEKKINGTGQPLTNIPTVPALAEDERTPRRMPKPKRKASKPKLKRHATAPSSSTLPDEVKPTNVVDDALTHRASLIRQELMHCEMEELAAEAEQAAESGMEKFVGSASKFGVEDTPPYRPSFADDEDTFVVTASPGLRTPSRRKALVDTLAAEYTPSYFQRKKIPLTSLRNISEVVPKFCDMHDNIQLHLGREGVDAKTLPDVHSRQSLMKSDTDDTRSTKEDADETFSVAASHAESISSFSTFAAQSLSSLKEMIGVVNRPKVPVDNSLRPSSSLPNPGPRVPVPRDIQQSMSLRNVSSDMGESVSERRNPPLPPISTHFVPAIAPADPDSDDSSVELYGRRTGSTNHSVCSHYSDISRTSALPRPRSNLSSSGDIKQPVLQRRRKKSSGASVSFEAEKANYQALLDRMQQKPKSPSVSFEAQSLTNLGVDILPSSSTIKSDKSTPVANFLSKLGRTFSPSNSEDANRKASMDEDSKQFVSNFFYTNETPSDADNQDDAVANPKLEINPQGHRDAYCLPGCDGDLLSACDVATKYADKLFEWLSVGDADQRSQTSAIIDPKSSESTTNASSRRRIFLPPKLSARSAATYEEEHECGDALACPEMSCSPGVGPSDAL